MLEIANKINRLEVQLEKRDQSITWVKICSSIGDILQCSVLAILILRADLRVRGALIDHQMADALGGRANDGGTPGEDELGF